MIVYNAKEWLSFIFSFHKSDTIRKLWKTLIVVAIFSFLIAYLEIDYLDLGKNSSLKNISIIHSLIGFVLSLLLVFRTNTAYDRWWEGRKLWGKLVNDSRNLSLKLNAFLPKDDVENREFFAKNISLFGQVLNTHLTKKSTRFALDQKEHPEIADILSKNHPPSAAVGIILTKINELYKEEKLTRDQFRYMDDDINGFMDVCGGCERIKNTPIPYSYIVFLKKFIALFVFSLPIGYVFTLGYWVVPLTAFIFYVLVSIELIAEEIEDPFNNDPNDIPTQKLADNIEKNVNYILLDKHAEF